MRPCLILTALITAMQLAGCDYRTRYEACTYTQPPAEAQRIPREGGDYLVFPATVSSDYTGCQKAWLPDGALQASLKYTKGQVTSVELPAVDGESQGCLFRNGDLLEGDESRCLPYKRWKFNIK